MNYCINYLRTILVWENGSNLSMGARGDTLTLGLYYSVELERNTRAELKEYRLARHIDLEPDRELSYAACYDS